MRGGVVGGAVVGGGVVGGGVVGGGVVGGGAEGGGWWVNDGRLDARARGVHRPGEELAVGGGGGEVVEDGDDDGARARAATCSLDHRLHAPVPHVCVHDLVARRKAADDRPDHGVEAGSGVGEEDEVAWRGADPLGDDARRLDQVCKQLAIDEAQRLPLGMRAPRARDGEAGGTWRAKGAVVDEGPVGCERKVYPHGTSKLVRREERRVGQRPLRRVAHGGRQRRRRPAPSGARIHHGLDRFAVEAGARKRGVRGEARQATARAGGAARAGGGGEHRMGRRAARGRDQNQLSSFFFPRQLPTAERTIHVVDTLCRSMPRPTCRRCRYSPSDAHARRALRSLPESSLFSQLAMLPCAHGALSLSTTRAGAAAVDVHGSAEGAGGGRAGAATGPTCRGARARARTRGRHGRSEAGEPLRPLREEDG